jgi:hypothetical protein
MAQLNTWYKMDTRDTNEILEGVLLNGALGKYDKAVRNRLDESEYHATASFMVMEKFQAP